MSSTITRPQAPELSIFTNYNEIYFDERVFARFSGILPSIDGSLLTHADTRVRVTCSKPCIRVVLDPDSPSRLLPIPDVFCTTDREGHLIGPHGMRGIALYGACGLYIPELFHYTFKVTAPGVRPFQFDIWPEAGDHLDIYETSDNFYQSTI